MADISPQVSSGVALQSTWDFTHYDFYWNNFLTCACLWTAITELGSQLTDVKARLAAQETEIKNADSKLQLSLSKAEKLKTIFDVEKKILGQ